MRVGVAGMRVGVVGMRVGVVGVRGGVVEPGARVLWLCAGCCCGAGRLGAGAAFGAGVAFGAGLGGGALGFSWLPHAIPEDVNSTKITSDFLGIVVIVMIKLLKGSRLSESFCLRLHR